MNILKAPIKIGIAFFAVMILLFSVGITRAQTDSTPKKRLKSLALVRGSIGGEAHDSYVIRVRKGQILWVQIS